MTRTSDGRLAVGRGLPGRGAWLCPGSGCLARAVARRSLPRALRADVAPEALRALGPSLGEASFGSRAASVRDFAVAPVDVPPAPSPGCPPARSGAVDPTAR